MSFVSFDAMDQFLSAAIEKYEEAYRKVSAPVTTSRRFCFAILTAHSDADTQKKL